MVAIMASVEEAAEMLAWEEVARMLAKVEGAE